MGGGGGRGERGGEGGGAGYPSCCARELLSVVHVRVQIPESDFQFHKV